MEARSSEASQLHRRCVVVHLRNLTDESFADLVQRGAGALLVIMPVRLDSPSQAQVSFADSNRIFGNYCYESVSVSVI